MIRTRATLYRDNGGVLEAADKFDLLVDVPLRVARHANAALEQGYPVLHLRTDDDLLELPAKDVLKVIQGGPSQRVRLNGYDLVGGRRTFRERVSVTLDRCPSARAALMVRQGVVVLRVAEAPLIAALTVGVQPQGTC